VNFEPVGKNFHPSGQNYQQDGQNFLADGEYFQYEGQIFYPNGQNFHPNGQNFQPNGQNLPPGGRNFQPHGLNFSPDVQTSQSGSQLSRKPPPPPTAPKSGQNGNQQPSTPVAFKQNGNPPAASEHEDSVASAKSFHRQRSGSVSMVSVKRKRFEMPPMAAPLVDKRGGRDRAASFGGTDVARLRFVFSNCSNPESVTL